MKKHKGVLLGGLSRRLASNSLISFGSRSSFTSRFSGLRWLSSNITNGRRVLVCGVDEAGRGPILGPLVIGTCILTPDVERSLLEDGVRDSKELSLKKREQLYRIIKERAVLSRTLHIPADEIDRRRRSGENLNKLQENATLQLLGSIFEDDMVVDDEQLAAGVTRSDSMYGELRGKDINGSRIKIGKDGDSSVTIYLDSVDVMPGRYAGIFNRHFPGARVIAKHKADSEFVVVGAASILAKVERDRAMKSLEEEVGMALGSGYPNDPVTKAFLKSHCPPSSEAAEEEEDKEEQPFPRFPYFVRRTWHR